MPISWERSIYDARFTSIPNGTVTTKDGKGLGNKSLVNSILVVIVLVWALFFLSCFNLCIDKELHTSLTRDHSMMISHYPLEDKMNTENITKLALSLVSSAVIAPTTEDGKSSLVFYLSGLTEEIGKKGAKVVVPAVISKRALTSLFEVIQGAAEDENATVLEALAEVRGSKIVSQTDKKIPGFSSWLASQECFNDVEERQFATRTILAAINNTIVENAKVASVADPLADVKRRFCKINTFRFLSVANNPGDLVVDAINAEIKNLEALKIKALEVSKEDYLAFLNEKEVANGQDEDGYVLLRGKKEEKKAEVVAPVSAEETVTV